MISEKHREELKQACAAVSVTAPELLAVEGMKWTLADAADLGPKMLRIERRLHEITGRLIDLRVESRDDKNKRVQRTGRA